MHTLSNSRPYEFTFKAEYCINTANLKVCKHVYTRLISIIIVMCIVAVYIKISTVEFSSKPFLRMEKSAWDVPLQVYPAICCIYSQQLRHTLTSVLKQYGTKDSSHSVLKQTSFKVRYGSQLTLLRELEHLVCLEAVPNKTCLA